MIILILLLALSVVLFIKTDNAHKNHIKIINAIYDYHMRCISQCEWDKCDQVFYDDREYFGKTIMRLTDWGYNNILPKEKFEIIKPYIVERKRHG